MFGIYFQRGISHMDVIHGFFKGMRKDIIYFRSILTREILWIIWKSYNEDKFQSRGRELTCNCIGQDLYVTCN